MLYITNLSSETRPVVLKGSLFNSGGDLVGETDNEKMPVTQLLPETNLLYPIEIIPSGAMIFYGDFETSIAKTGRLPEGSYQMGVELLDPEHFQPIAPVQFASFFIQGYDPPILVFPPDGYGITDDNLNGLTFQWTPLNPQPRDFTAFYRFVIYEVFPGQEPWDAILSNPPVFQQYISYETQFTWEPEIILPSTVTELVWNIQTLNQHDLPFTDNDGWTEPYIIHILKDTASYTTYVKIPPIVDSIPPDTLRQPEEPVHDTVVITGTTTQADTVPYRPPHDTIIEQPRFPPEEYIPPDTFNLTRSCGPDFSIEPGIPIDLGMVLENPAVFPYPRAVPIRAEGIDYDYAVFECTGCGSDAKFYKSVEDHVSNFTWKLTGPGSLNTPFDLKDLQQEQDSLDQIMKRLQAIEDSLKWIEEQITRTIPDKIAETEKKIADNKKLSAEKDSLLTVLETRRDSVETRLDSLAEAIEGHEQLIRTWEDSITSCLARIDSLQGVLDGKPTAAMQSLLDQLKSLYDEIDNLKTQLADKEQEIADRGEELARDVYDADSSVLVAARQYQELRDQAQLIARQITDLETALMANPVYREFLTRKKDWNNKVGQFTGEFHIGGTTLSNINSSQTDLNSLATEAISTSVEDRRLELASQFADRMSAFKSQINGACGGLEAEQREACNSASAVVQEASDGYSSELDTIVRSTYVYNRENDERLEELRGSLSSLEGSIAAAKEEVESRAEEAQTARETYTSEMERLENERLDLSNNLTSVSDSVASIEIAYNRLKLAQTDSLAVHREDYLAAIHDKRLRIMSFDKNISDKSDTLSDAIADSLETSSFKKDLDRQVEEMETYKQRVDELISNLENLVDALKQKMEELKAQKARLEKEKEELEKKKEEKKKKQEQKLTGTKTAAGQFVYYIPPPLEEIIKDKTEFERLKKEVEKAEDSLKAAYAYKQSVQFRLVKEIEKISRGLEKLGSLDTMINAMEEEKAKLEEDLAKLKNNKTIDNKDKQVELERILDEAKEAKKTSEEKIKEYEEDSTTVSKEIDELKEKVEEKDTAIAELERDLLEKNAQWKYEENQLDNIRKTHQDYANKLTAARIELNENEESAGRAKSALTRASATGDQAGINAARQEIDRLEAQHRSIATRISSLEASLASASSSLESAQLRVKNAEESFNEVLKEIREAKIEKKELEDELADKNEDLEEVISGLEHWKKTEEKAEKLEEKTNEAREALQEDISKGINKDEEVVNIKKEIDGLEKKIGDSEKSKTDQVNAINQSIEKKDKIIDEADEKLKTAQENKDKAEKELHGFLVKQFELVSYNVTLELKGDDEVVDGYRYDDPKTELTMSLSYQGSRTPVLQNKYASGSLSDKTLPGNCYPQVTFNPPNPPEKAMDPVPGREPRTIALIYKDGKPLWKEWPVLPPRPELVARDVVPADVAFTVDHDQKIHVCMVQEGDCQVPPPLVGSIVDLGLYLWEPDGRIISNNPRYNRIMWEPPLIPRPLKEDKKKLDCKYNASGLAPDEPPEAKSKHLVKPGILLEVTDSIVGTPETTDTIVARVVTGDHKPISGEDIEFSLERIEGESEDYGFESSDSLKVKKTDGDGYAKVGFNYGDGFAKFKIYVKWKRGENVIEEDESMAVCPITLQFVRFSGGITTEAWDMAMELFEAGKEAGEEELAEKAKELVSKDDEADSTKDLPVHAIVGLIDYEKDFLEDETVIFQPPTNITLEPDSTQTKSFGLARTEVKDLPPDAKITMEASVEEKYEPVGRPSKDKASLSTTKIDRFKIGSSDNLFTILLDEPVSEGEVATGTGKLSAEIAEGLMAPLEDISLNINDVELEGDAQNKTAVSGSVSYAGSPGISVSILSFDLTLDSLVITASMGAGIGGTIKRDSMETAVKFYGEMEPTGDFMGTVSDLPEISVAGFKITEGASFTVDMHSSKSPPGFKDDFKGIIIYSASLQLPETFNTNEGATPSKLHAEDLFIGTSGVGGTVSYSGTLLKFGFAGCDFEVDSVSVKFENSDVKEAALSGKIALPSPMEGKIQSTISKAGTKWSAKVSTEDPVSIPRLATAFTLMEGTGLEYDSGTKIATFNLDAVISSEKYGDITIRDFMINSKGKISASNISVNKAIKFGSGFSLEVKSLSFLVDGSEYNLTLDGGFAFPLIGAEEVLGTVTVSPGPAVSVKFKKASIHFNKGPVEFDGSLELKASEFKGQFEITLENLKQIKGISGLFIIGNSETPYKESYTYWYAEMVLAGAVPLGQTGLSLLQLGAGLGYNYNPPVGSKPGSPVYSEAFSFKAIIGMGTAPGGEIMAGRMEMVLASGYFTLYGKVWLLQQEKSMYGEGSLSFFWAPENKLEGFVGMFIGIPDENGKVLMFRGRINFLYSGTDKYIRSEKIEGAFMEAVMAKGTVDVTPEYIKLNGSLNYNLDKKLPLAIVTINAHLNVNAEGHFDYIHASSTLSAGANFHGDWNVNLDTPFGTANIISGVIDLLLQLQASPSFVDVKGSAHVAWDIWIYKDSVELDVGYHSDF